MTARTTTLALLLALASACGREPEPEPRPADAPPPDEGAGPPREGLSQADVEALMALPYAGFVEEDEETAAREGLLSIDRARSYPGYTLFSVYEQGMAVLVDHEGRVVHHWRAPEPSRWAHVELLEDGEILTTGIVGREEQDERSGLERRYALRMTWSGEVVWLVYNSAHHEMTRDPAGRIVTLTAETRRVRLPDDPEGGRERIRDNLVTVLDESGATVSSVSLYDMVAARPDEFPLNLSSIKERKKRLTDLIHANAIEWMPSRGPDVVVLSMRHQDRIALFDLARQELLWAWGLGEISGPHDVQPLANGHLLLLDNGVASGRSRVVEVDPDQRRIVWQWQAPEPADFFTPTKGSVQRLPNGNTLVGNADQGEVFEVTPEGDVVWRYLSPVRNDQGKRSTLHRARRFEPAFIEGLVAEHGTDPDFR